MMWRPVKTTNELWFQGDEFTGSGHSHFGARRTYQQIKKLDAAAKQSGMLGH